MVGIVTILIDVMLTCLVYVTRWLSEFVNFIHIRYEHDSRAIRFMRMGWMRATVQGEKVILTIARIVWIDIQTWSEGGSVMWIDGDGVCEGDGEMRKGISLVQ